jgi:thioredoxin-like negative regulator of GroEL
MNRNLAALLLMIVTIAGCATTAPPVGPATPPANTNLLDPRSGWSSALSPASARRFDEAWRDFTSGYFDSANRKLDAILKREPGAAPALLAKAAIAIERNELDVAGNIVGDLRATHPSYLAAEVYAAEIELARGEIAKADALYAEIARRPDMPSAVTARALDVRRRWFDELMRRAADNREDPRSLIYLREALAIDPSSSNARLELVRRLVASKRFEDARREIDPLLKTTDVERNDVQELAAEIEVGAGRHQEAIQRLERLARLTRDERIEARLATVKREWREANLPMQYRRALESQAITRADLSVLLYWNLDSIRFAAVGEPPIAVDLANVIGREELVRALALRLFQVDPITRRVDPLRTVTASSFARTLMRVAALQRRACAEGAESLDSSGQIRALERCGVSAGVLLDGPDAPVSGRQAAQVIERFEAAGAAAAK